MLIAKSDPLVFSKVACLSQHRQAALAKELVTLQPSDS